MLCLEYEEFKYFLILFADDQVAVAYLGNDLHVTVHKLVTFIPKY